MPRSSARVLAALIAARVASEAIAFGCVIAMAHPATGGASPLSLSTAVAAFAGVALPLVALLRETATERAGGAIVAVTLAASVVLALALPARGLDAVGWLGRAIVFSIIAEVFLWRVLSIARGAVRWSDARNAAPFAASAVVLCALVPLAVDRTPLPALALALVAAVTIALALARATEELSLIRGGARAGGLGSVTSLLFGLGLLSLAVAVVAPFAEELLARTGAALAEAWGVIVFVLLLPLGYLAALVLLLLAPLIRGLNLSFFPRSANQPSIEEQEAVMREIERNRPFVVGGVELLIVLVVIGVALVLLDRIVRERRLALPEGGVLERSAASGVGLGAMLRAILPAPRAARRPPRDDGSAAAALRLLYWRMLALGERTGHGWRAPGETPHEHHTRIARADARWSEAAPLVVAFEELRYGERDPDRATLAQARHALHALESAIRT